MSAKENEMLMHIVLLQVHRLLGAFQVVEKAQSDDDGIGLRRLRAIGAYRKIREDIINRDDRQFGRAVSSVSMAWEDVQQLLVGFDRCDAEILIGWFSLEDEELLRYAHGRRNCHVSDAFNIEAYPIQCNIPPKQRLPIPVDTLRAERRVGETTAMVHVRYSIVDQEGMFLVRYEFFLRALL